MASADEGGAEAGELALAGGWEAVEEGVGDGETEDSVADELKLLVVGGGIGEGLGVGLVGERAVGESPGEEFGALEFVIEELRRRGVLRLRSSGLSVARRHGTPLRSTLPERCGCGSGRWSHLSNVSVGVGDDRRLSRLCH